MTAVLISVLLTVVVGPLLKALLNAGFRKTNDTLTQIPVLKERPLAREGLSGLAMLAVLIGGLVVACFLILVFVGN
jgi:hypothetical protein